MEPAALTHTGRVWKFGDNINTDLILPNTAFRLPRDQMHRHAFQAIRPEWIDAVKPGDLIIAGENFGMGSGRPVGQVLRACGIAGIAAESINGLCLRNCVNASLPAIDCSGVTTQFEDGDLARIDFMSGRINNLTRNSSIVGKPLAPLLANIVHAGGIIQMLIKEGYIEDVPFAAPST